MATISQTDLIDSIADSLQFMSYFHPLDFITAVNEAYEREESQAAKAAMAQILINSRMCAQGRRPICQDTGIVTVFVNVGMDVSWDAELSLSDMINEGVRRAYTLPDNVLRASIQADPAGARKNTLDEGVCLFLGHRDRAPEVDAGRFRRRAGLVVHEERVAGRVRQVLEEVLQGLRSVTGRYVDRACGGREAVTGLRGLRLVGAPGKRGAAEGQNGEKEWASDHGWLLGCV